MRSVAVALASVGLLFAAGAGAATTVQPASGLRGIVTRGPTKPVCFDTESCDERAAGVVLRFRRAGRLVAQVKTGPAGGYRARLRAGVYTVTVPQQRIGRGLTPPVVRVPRGRFARLDFSIDTGIR